jgi:transcriptional regulator with XRE-family HTH domain
MGRSPRPRPRKLPAKLRQIRRALGMSQSQMLVALKLDKALFSSTVSGYELGRREPPLPVLLRYARLAGVSMDALVDDDLNLPAKLPSKRRSCR